jgi:hypothetical protein
VATEGERIATVEQIARDIRDDQRAFGVEQERARKRLHELESTVQGLVIAASADAQLTRRRQRALEIRLQILTVVIALAAIFEPFIYHYSKF